MAKREVVSKEELDLHTKDWMHAYLHGPLDAGKQLMVKHRTGHVDLKERRKRPRNVDKDDNISSRITAVVHVRDRIHMVGAELPI